MLNMKEVRRIVVKVGSSTLTYDNGKPNIRRIEQLVRTISDLQNRGFEMVLVSSAPLRSAPPSWDSRSVRASWPSSRRRRRSVSAN